MPIFEALVPKALLWLNNEGRQRWRLAANDSQSRLLGGHGCPAAGKVPHVKNSPQRMQAGTAMLAQANSLPQSILRLLG